MGLKSKTLAFVLGLFLFVLPTAQAYFHMFGWEDGGNVNFSITGSTTISPFGSTFSSSGLSALHPSAGSLQSALTAEVYHYWVLEDSPAWGSGGFVLGNYTGDSFYFFNGDRFGLLQGREEGGTYEVATMITFAGSFASLGLSAFGFDYTITGANSETDVIQVIIEAPPPVPEPASISLLGLAAIGGYLIRRKRS